jgi:Xaa-Pro aminopeptidase
MRDNIRIQRNRAALGENGLAGVVCGLPSNVLLLTGYFPVIGTSIAVATPDRTFLLVPEDEKDLAAEGWADEVRAFESASLQWIKPMVEAIEPALRDMLAGAALKRARIGYKSGDWLQPSSYAAAHFFGGAMLDLLTQCADSPEPVSAKVYLEELGLKKTPNELAHIGEACEIAGRAFEQTLAAIVAGKSEALIAGRLRELLLQPTAARRADGFGYCMSGPNAAEAHKAYQRTTQRELREHDLVLVHCNSHVHGYWTDITRTYCLGAPNDRQRRMYDAVFEARQAALNAIKPGARARDVDQAARGVMARRDFGNQLVTPLGHGVGFAAVDHNAKPRLHPKSNDVLEPGMVFNIEPGIYFKGECGMRHCDMVVVTEFGAEVLTPFQDRAEWLTC